MKAIEFLDELRRMGTAELEELGQRSMLDHVVSQAEVAREKHGPVTFEKLESLLCDPVCVRHPVRLVYEFGEMALHQFAQPDHDWRDDTGRGRVLYLRPTLKEDPSLVVLAVAYFIPVINYGDVASDAHCTAYGAALLGMSREDFYRQVCTLADQAGAETKIMSAGSPGCCGQVPDTPSQGPCAE